MAAAAGRAAQAAYPGVARLTIGGDAGSALSVRSSSSGIILAGGASERMGRDKLALEVGGVPIVRRVYDVLEEACAEVLVAGPRDLPLPEGTRYVPDLRPGREGPLAGMEAGLSAARGPLVFVAAGDMPFLSPELAGYLLAVVREGAQAAVPWRDGPQPLCAAYSRSVLPLIRCALDGGVRSVRRFLGSLDRVVYLEEELEEFGDPDLMLMNVNTPGALERARRAALRSR